MDEHLEFAKKLALEAGGLIANNFGKNFEVELKSDATPVTAVDTQINDIVVEAVKSTYPDHGLLGEEGNYGSGEEEFQWLCDPIDGTKCFVLGVPNCTFMLALTKNGKILLTVVYDPFTKKLYHAVKNGGAYCNGKPMHVNKQGVKEGYVIVEASSFPYVAGLERAGAIVEPVPGTGYMCSMLANGRCTAVIKGQADNHDIGPGSLLIEEAGGKVTALDGSSLRFDTAISGAILSNGVNHDMLIQIAASV